MQFIYEIDKAMQYSKHFISYQYINYKFSEEEE